jgi:multidrug efflux pump subunit AcrA (membrane-fusion protein)
MLLTKLKTAITAFLIVGVMTLGAGSLIFSGRPTEPAAAAQGGQADNQPNRRDPHNRVQELKRQLAEAEAALREVEALMKSAEEYLTVHEYAVRYIEEVVKAKASQLAEARTELEKRERLSKILGARNDPENRAAAKKVEAAQKELDAESVKLEGLQKIRPVAKKDQAIAAVAEATAAVNRLKAELNKILQQSQQKESRSAPDDPKPDVSFLAERFKFKVPFEIGHTQTDGGRIEIREVWGTRPKIAVGGQYLVRGKYTLPRSERGKLYCYTTASGPQGATTNTLDLQVTALDKQEGEFALVQGMPDPGYFHLILTAADSYSRGFANVYFGTGDNVLQEKP